MTGSESRGPQNVIVSDIADDAAQQHVLHCFQELGHRGEVMFVFSQMSFTDYLSKLGELLQPDTKDNTCTTENDCVEAEEKETKADRNRGSTTGRKKRKDVKKTGKELKILLNNFPLKPIAKDGDFDVLVVHREYGVLVGEIKTRGRGEYNSQEESDSGVAQSVLKSIKQLEKSKVAVKHIVGEVAPNLMVRTTLILPFVTTEQLERVFMTHPKLVS
nr:hypothetical protein BaRGS_005125 [Batillaria attramentaria]